jgi:inorganic pyrophosphatase
MSELPPHLSQEVEHFFQVYKTLEHKETTGFEVLGRKEALRIIEESIVSYQEIFGDGQKTCK